MVKNILSILQTNPRVWIWVTWVTSQFILAPRSSYHFIACGNKCSCARNVAITTQQSGLDKYLISWTKNEGVEPATYRNKDFTTGNGDIT